MPQLIGRLNPQKHNRPDYTIDAETLKAMDGKLIACIGLDVYGPFDSYADIDAWRDQRKPA